MVDLSIVIPYYQTYELTEKLLEILMPQLNNKVQVILVDDGCNEIRLDKFKEYIEILHLEKNVGNGSALNVGIRKAKGKYIGVIDSDDLIVEDYIKTLLEEIEKNDCDLITMDWQDLHSKDIIRRPSNYAPWRSIYKRDMIPLFPEGMRYSADVPFQDEVCRRKKSEYFIDKVLYIYNSNRPRMFNFRKKENLWRQ